MPPCEPQEEGKQTGPQAWLSGASGWTQAWLGESARFSREWAEGCLRAWNKKKTTLKIV